MDVVLISGDRNDQVVQAEVHRWRGLAVWTWQAERAVRCDLAALSLPWLGVRGSPRGSGSAEVERFGPAVAGWVCLLVRSVDLGSVSADAAHREVGLAIRCRRAARRSRGDLDFARLVRNDPLSAHRVLQVAQNAYRDRNFSGAVDCDLVLASPACWVCQLAERLDLDLDFALPEHSDPEVEHSPFQVARNVSREFGAKGLFHRVDAGRRGESSCLASDDRTGPNAGYGPVRPDARGRFGVVGHCDPSGQERADRRLGENDRGERVARAVIARVFAAPAAVAMAARVGEPTWWNERVALPPAGSRPAS